jgi:tetratricopeptide (TPR) repeat protein
VLDVEEQAAIRFQIAQLYLAEERWRDVVTNLEQWFSMVESPNSSAYYLLAIAYYQLEDLDSALPPALKALEVAEVPQEGWLQLVLALRLTRKEYAEAVPLLEQLIHRYPKKIYWIQLSTVHGALGSYEEALIPLQLAYSQGLLTEDEELRRLSQLLLFLDLPYRAAVVLEGGLEEGSVEPDAAAYEQLSNSWIAAREYEKAAAPLARAAELSEGGDLYVRLAQVHIQREKWSEAAEALRRALDKGELANQGDAQLLMGIAYYSQKEPQQALRWFARARQHEATRQEAEVWVRYIERELGSG